MIEKALVPLFAASPLEVASKKSETSWQTWADRLDQLKRIAQLKDDTDLAAYLGVVKGTIHQFRRKEAELGTVTRLIVLEKLGCEWAAEGLLELTPRKQATQLSKHKENELGRAARTFLSLSTDE